MKRILFLILLVMIYAIVSFAQTTEIKFSKSSKNAENVSEFKSGEFIYVHLKFAQPLANILTIGEKPTTLIAEYYNKGKMMDDEMFGFEAANVKKSKQSMVILPIISDTANDVNNYGKNLFSVRLPASLAKLPEGKHEIEFKLKSYEYKNGDEPLATGKFTLSVESGSTSWFKQNEKDAMAAFSKRGITSVDVSARDAAMGVVGGTSVITLVNNCGKSVWLRKANSSDKTEYRLAPGDTMRYDRDGSNLEEWNFGTQKWSGVTKVWTVNTNGRANICSK